MEWLHKLWNPTTQKWLRRGRRTLWCVLLLAFIWFAVVRWTTPPAAVTRGMTGTTKHVKDDLNELVALLESLPRFTPGQGGWYDLPLKQVSYGRWTHDRTLIKDSVAYLTAPPTASNVLDQLDAYLAANLTGAASLDSGIGAGIPLAPTYRTDPMTWGRAVTTFTARARYRAAELGDLSGALADLRAASRLVWIVEQHGDQLFAYYRFYGQHANIAGIALLEWVRTALEHPLPPALAREMITFLRDELSLSAVLVVQRATGIGQDATAFLDRYYTNDGHGNGWVVLSHAAPALSFPFRESGNDTGKPRSGFWNLFSPLFNDRATVQAKVERWHGATSRLDEIEASELPAMLARVGLSEQGFGGPAEVLNGPVSSLRRQLHTESCVRLHSEVARRRALVVMLALAAYRHDHAAYPESLDALMPQYLDVIPIDLYAQAPFAYERLADDRYHLAPGGPSPPPWRHLLTDRGARVEAYSIARPAPSE